MRFQGGSTQVRVLEVIEPLLDQLTQVESLAAAGDPSKVLQPRFHSWVQTDRGGHAPVCIVVVTIIRLAGACRAQADGDDDISPSSALGLDHQHAGQVGAEHPVLPAGDVVHAGFREAGGLQLAQHIPAGNAIHQRARCGRTGSPWNSAH